MALDGARPSSHTIERERCILTCFFMGARIAVLGTTSISPRPRLEHHIFPYPLYIRSAANPTYMPLISVSAFLPATAISLASTILPNKASCTNAEVSSPIAHTSATVIFPKFQVCSCKASGQFFPARVFQMVPNDLSSDAQCPRNSCLC